MRLLFPIVAALAVVAAGCGGGSSSPTTAADWAKGYCSGASAWVTALGEARASVKPGDPSATASDAAQQMTDASNTFIEVVDGLGAPATPDGSTTEETAKNLSSTLSGRIARASAAIDTNNASVSEAERAKVVSDQVTASLADLTTATAKIKTDDTAVGTAMGAESTCADLDTALQAAG